jgi:TolB-like protein/DNA-binding winged helix-turn-helix (wHTH) protein/Tfp pilus assembly protein PilF
VATAFEPVEIVSFGESFELNRATLELRRDGRTVRLERIPFDILLMLIGRRGQLLTRGQIAQRIWGRNRFLDIASGLDDAMGKIRQALRDDPENPRFIETVGTRGYRFIAPLSSALTPQLPVAHAVPMYLPAGLPPVLRAPRHNPRLQWLLGGVGLLVVAGALGLSLHISRMAPASEGYEPLRLAVLPLINLTGNPKDESLSDGLTQKLIAQLGTIEPDDLAVSAPKSVMRYKNSSVPADQIARNLHAKYVLEGSVRRDGDLVHVTAQLVRADDQVRVWTEQYDHQLTSVPAMEEEVAAIISNRVHNMLTGHDAPVTAQREAAAGPAAAPAASSREATANPSAHAKTTQAANDPTERARFYVSQHTTQGLAQGIALFQRAIALDPNYAPAWAGLAEAYTRSGASGTGARPQIMAQARAAAAKAIMLDPSLADAHVAQGAIAEKFDYDWPTAEREFQQAIGLDPRSSAAHGAYAALLAREGQFAPALAESARALAVNPLSPSLGIEHASVLYLAGRYAQAAQALQRTLAVAPSDAGTALLVASYAQQGRLDEALTQTVAWHAAAANATASATAAYLYGRAGQSAEAQQALLTMEEEARNEGTDPLPLRALALAGIGDREQLLDTLDAAYDERADFVTMLKVDPAYAALAGDARFEDLKHRIGLD